MTEVFNSSEPTKFVTKHSEILSELSIMSTNIGLLDITFCRMKSPPLHSTLVKMKLNYLHNGTIYNFEQFCANTNNRKGEDVFFPQFHFHLLRTSHKL